jgi:hypothetical protein
MTLSPSRIVLHAGTSIPEETLLHLGIGLFRFGLGVVLAVPVVYLVYRPQWERLAAVGRVLWTRLGTRKGRFALVLFLVVSSFVGLDAFWYLRFYGTVDWASVLGSATLSRMPLFALFAAYVTVLGDSLDGLLPWRTRASGVTGGLTSAAFVMVACPSCVFALVLLLASFGLVGGATLSSFLFMNQLQAYAGWFTIGGVAVMVVGMYALTNARCAIPSGRNWKGASSR